MFSWAERWRKDFSDSDGDNAFESYLDGYFNSFDFYPACTRKLHENSDAYALWVDFLKVAQDVESANISLMASPERFLAMGALSRDEIEIRKKIAQEQTTKRLTGGGSAEKPRGGDTT